MLRETPLITGEYYHVFNRGAHKQRIYNNEADYRRFLLLLYLANNTERIHLGNLMQKYKGRSWMDVLEVPTDKTLVEVLTYSLMPNHFHLVLRQKSDNGITMFLKKVATAYSMYFNTKYEHSGVVFQGRFKSRHIDNEAYFRYIFSYIHLNPIELIEPKWKENGLNDPDKIRHFLNTYEYSSHVDYAVGCRLTGKILSYAEAPEFLKTQNDLEDLINSYTTSRTVLDVEGGDNRASSEETVVESGQI